MWHHSSSLLAAFAFMLTANPAAAQVEITVHGGIVVGGADGSRHAREKAPSRLAPNSSRLLGEATTAGARVGVGVSERWSVDGGIAWSRSSNRDGAVSRPAPSFESQTLFVSSTVQGWLTEPGSRLGVVAGAGPAMIVQRARDGSTGQQTNLGGMLTLGGVMRLDHQFSVRIDAQQYLFSRPFEEYTPHLGAVPRHRSSLRHDFVLLAGFSWRSD
jgi:Outer membrane protein beta-barrel domain